MKRKVCYVTGSRADFGLMASSLELAHSAEGLDLEIAVTGTHLEPAFGASIRDVEALGLPISVFVRTPELNGTGVGMALALASALRGFVSAWEARRPDIVMVLGDRGEMLAAAIAASHLDIPIAHVHGGERSGTIDESLRHAITKLSHLHFTATEASRDRLQRMGERADRIWVTGAPGLDGLERLATKSREMLCRVAGFHKRDPIALFCYHPVLQDGPDMNARAAGLVIEALRRSGVQVFALAPNADAGSSPIRLLLETQAAAGQIRLTDHLPRGDFVSWMAAADLMIGNSSSGIIEAATFGTPVVNIGDRQLMRERNANVLDTVIEQQAIEIAIDRALGAGRIPGKNIFGDGFAGQRIVKILQTVSLTDGLTRKCYED